MRARTYVRTVVREIFVWEIDFSNRGTERRGGRSVNFFPPFSHLGRAHYHPSREVRFAKSHAKSKDFLSLVAESHSTRPWHDGRKLGERPLPLPLLLHGQPWCARACPSIRAHACTPSLPRSKRTQHNAPLSPRHCIIRRRRRLETINNLLLLLLFRPGWKSRRRLQMQRRRKEEEEEAA